MSGQPQLLSIPVKCIRVNTVALREVNEEDLDFIQMKDSIAKDGLLNPINVVMAVQADGHSPLKDEDGDQVYRIVDGAHRFTACRSLGHKTINCQVLNKTEVQIMVAQLVANTKRVTTKPKQLAEHVNRILGHDATKTVAELATEFSCTASWLNEVVGLVNLNKEIGEIVDAGKITVSNAIELSKLPPAEQESFVQAAISDGTQEFANKARARLKEIRDAKRAGRDPNAEPTFVPNPHYRKKGEVEAAQADPAGGVLGQLVRNAGISDPIEAVRFALSWILHLDEQSLAEGRAKFDAQRAQVKADAERRAKERAERKLAAGSAK